MSIFAKFAIFVSVGAGTIIPCQIRTGIGSRSLGSCLAKDIFHLRSLKVPLIKPKRFPQDSLSLYWQTQRCLTEMGDLEEKKAELKKRLTPLQYHVTQEKGTERAFSGEFYKTSDSGTYSCIVCHDTLFSSETKFDSGCGWPAFNDVLDQGKVKLTKDTSHGMVRTEVTCARCGAHLGHVFEDGPPPTRKRFCINSASLEFHPAGGVP